MCKILTEEHVFKNINRGFCLMCDACHLAMAITVSQDIIIDAGRSEDRYSSHQEMGDIWVLVTPYSKSLRLCRQLVASCVP